MSTYTPIATQTLGSAVDSVTFSSLPQNYTDLIIVINTKFSITLSALSMQYNGDTSSSYSYTRVYGNDLNQALSDRSSNNNFARFGFSSIGDFNTGVYQINNYSNSTTYKTGLGRSGILDYGGYVFNYVNLWRNTNPITSIRIFAENGSTFAANSTFSIYGIAAGNSSAKASGGNIVTTDGTYWYHAFTSSGTFIPNSALTADVLVVAGGGGGAGDVGGGGGAGGVLYASAKSLASNTAYTCTIGAGGVKGIQGGTDPGTSGGDSYFDVLKAFGGAYGASAYVNGIAGGSGAGGGGGTNTTGGSSNQTSNNGGTGYGNAGGGGGGSGNTGAGGGGGAGAAGSTASGSNGGNGGNGLNTWSSWASATGTGVSGYYAGGGGGGAWGGSTSTGGAGGGGNGGQRSSSTNGGDGVANTGSGGGGDGGGSPVGTGGNGGSGIIIIRYAV